MGKRYRVTYGQMRKSELLGGAMIGERKSEILHIDSPELANPAVELFLKGRPMIGDLVELPPLGISPEPNRDAMPVYEAN